LGFVEGVWFELGEVAWELWWFGGCGGVFGVEEFFGFCGVS